MYVSICIATYNHSELLDNTLRSIFSQSPTIGYEVIVVDDGSTDSTPGTCLKWPVRYLRIERPEKYRNPAVPRNVAYSLSRGEILILQSDDVMHVGDDCIERLASELKPKQFVIANVFNTDRGGKPVKDNYQLIEYTGPNKKRPLFFLGSILRSDLFTVGGNDEDFIYPGREDVWFAKCLLMQGLTPYYPSTITGHHQNHPRSLSAGELQHSSLLFNRKLRSAVNGTIPWKAENSRLFSASSASL